MNIDKQSKDLGTTPLIWLNLLSGINLQPDSTVVEVAPGHEPKIGLALSLLGWRGTLYLVEPNADMAHDIRTAYRRLLPQVRIKIVRKFAQNIVTGIDIPTAIEAVVASHPFDDMVLAQLTGTADIFSRERADGTKLSDIAAKTYQTLRPDDYARGIRQTVATWQTILTRLQPRYFIASQYPSQTLRRKKLLARQRSGYAVLNELKRCYRTALLTPHFDRTLGEKSQHRWWIAAENPAVAIRMVDLSEQPRAIERLSQRIFVTQPVRTLRSSEYDIAYVDQRHFAGLTSTETTAVIRNLAVQVDNRPQPSSDIRIAHVDRQCDRTDIALDGNLGSGRAVYLGRDYNVLGVGRTKLCHSAVPSHSTGRLEMVGAMRRIVLSNWLEIFGMRNPPHLALICLKQTAKFKWHNRPLPLVLLVRLDQGGLDRPSHIEADPTILVDFDRVLTEYARLDAEYFAYRFLLGAWSNSNYSLCGHIIDLESASFVKCRGPYYTSTGKHPHNLFGYEGFGFRQVLQQLATSQKLPTDLLARKFNSIRSRHLTRCFLRLIGVPDDKLDDCLMKHLCPSTALTRQFEILSKKITTVDVDMNLYRPLASGDDPTLLDMSELFRHLADIFHADAKSQRRAFDCVIRKKALNRVSTTDSASRLSDQPAHEMLMAEALITRTNRDNFLCQTRQFIYKLWELLAALERSSFLTDRQSWHRRLQFVNQDLPNMFKLNRLLIAIAERYTRGQITATDIGREIASLNQMYKRPTDDRIGDLHIGN
jgi:hypothetical protein